MARCKIIKQLISILLFSYFSFCCFGEIIQDNDYNYSLDIPEGFALQDASEDNMSFHFIHPAYPVQLILKVYDNPAFINSEDVLDQTLTKLHATKQIDNFIWNDGQICSISDFSMTLDKSYSGWAVCAPLQKKSSYITLLCYSDTEQRDGCNPFIMSVLNSLCINEDYYSYPGIILSYAFPTEGKKNISVNISGYNIQTSIDKSDIDAAQFLIDMEFNVLKLYANHNLWKEAWQRYYRMIYRDSFGRMAQCSYDIINKLYPICEKQNPSNPELTFAQTLLSWVQTFNYERNTASAASSDFTSLPAAISGHGNDCDSRSMLVSVILRAAGIDSFILISRDYSHAMTTLGIDAPGQKYTVPGTDYEFLMGETTAKVTWGTIAQEHSDRSKWIPVLLP